jgi:hypothetical protein
VTYLRRFTEGLAFLLAGLLVGWLAVTLAPEPAGPMIAGTVAMALGGRMMFDGTFNWLGLGLMASSLATLAFYIRDFADVGGA